MPITFQEDKECLELDVLVRKAAYDKEVEQLLAYLGQFGLTTPEVIPIKTSDRIQMIKLADLIAVDVEGTSLRLYTCQGQLLVTDRLYKFQEKVNSPDIIQVSKQTLINVKHLDYLEASFSGNMTAFLTNKVKVTVSRRYLKALEKTLGL